MNIWGMRSLSQFTICFWMKSTDAAKGTAFSYNVPNQDNELIIYNYGNLTLYINADQRKDLFLTLLPQDFQIQFYNYLKTNNTR